MTEGPHNSAVPAPRRVLLVDNSVELAELLAEIIRTEPALHYVGHVSTGAEAFEKIQTVAIDVLLLDLGLEDCDGFEVLARLRRAQLPVRVIVHSGHASPELAAHARQMGAAAYVVKDGDIAALLAAIHAA
jgi:DNA-binding NarL/FixJ family response regulator